MKSSFLSGDRIKIEPRQSRCGRKLICFEITVTREDKLGGIWKRAVLARITSATRESIAEVIAKATTVVVVVQGERVRARKGGPGVTVAGD